MFLLVVVFMAVEFVAAFVAGSVALLADAGHMLTDAVGLGMALAAMAVAEKTARADHPTYGRLEAVANPVMLSETPATIRMPAPEVGQHTEEVLLEYGYTWEDIAQFKDKGIIA